MGGEKVIVILDASKDVLNCVGMIERLSGLPLCPGDELTLLGVIPQNSNSMKTKLNRSSTNPRYSGEEVSRKKEQLYQTLEILRESTMGKIKLNVEMKVGSPRKAIVVEAAVDLGATWIILDRVMKKDKKYFVKKLACKISKLKHDNTVQLLRGALRNGSIEGPPNRSPSSNGQVSYDEMIPGDSLEEQLCQSPKTLEVRRLSPTSLDQQGNQNTIVRMEQKCTAPYNDQALWQCEEENEKTYICSVCKNRRPRIGGHTDYKYAELYEATQGFSDDNFLGEGGFGSVYKGELRSNGLKIAVKHHKGASLQGEKEFKSEVEVLSKVRHENLVMLLGSCSDGSERLIVYEYVCNDSLDDHLQKHANRFLRWEQRMKIALGTAKGLQCLHSHNIVHRDLRPSNILITHDYESLLGDFGLAKAQHDSSNSDNGVVGTLGYMAPEYAQTGKYSIKTDVYSFGVVLLQLITGRRTTDAIPGGKSLIGWAKPLLKDRNYPDLIDRRILDSHDFLQLFWMVRLIEKCIRSDPSERLTIDEVVKTLNSIKEGSTTYLVNVPPISDSLGAEENGRMMQ